MALSLVQIPNTTNQSASIRSLVPQNKSTQSTTQYPYFATNESRSLTIHLLHLKNDSTVTVHIKQFRENSLSHTITYSLKKTTLPFPHKQLEHPQQNSTTNPPVPIITQKVFNITKKSKYSHKSFTSIVRS